ncbi:ComGF family competence protein [Virgibacillus pantothenticus]|uniref:ComGF family competence protein n=1 Tax=Virgibacillus pantothenticus TaxID=1473 RepID=UPI0025B147C0|nr:ComGF family competence protein [Virgibacillus pantothenticus]
MLNKRTKNYAFTPYHHESGFTLVTTLITIGILVFSIPFVSYVLRDASTTVNSNTHLSVGQFFIFMRNEVIQAQELKIYPDQLKLIMQNGDEATFVMYGSLVRRQVDNTGHEIYLRDVKNISFSPLPYGLQVTVTTIEGEQHDKEIIFYP